MTTPDQIERIRWEDLTPNEQSRRNGFYVMADDYDKLADRCAVLEKELHQARIDAQTALAIAVAREDARDAENAVLIADVAAYLRAEKSCSGYEPSLGVYDRAYDRLKEIATSTPNERATRMLALYEALQNRDGISYDTPMSIFVEIDFGSSANAQKFVDALAALTPTSKEESR